MFQIRGCLANCLVAGALASAALLPVPAAEAATEKVLHSFGSVSGDGDSPAASLMDVKGVLYGTTQYGGDATACPASSITPAGCGTVFSINPTTGTETVLHKFKGGGDGASPYAGVIGVNGTLYGTTLAGGGNITACPAGPAAPGGCGTVFSINPKTGAETVLHSFGSGTDGVDPFSGLIDVNGTLYGTTFFGGGAALIGEGTVFSITLSGSETVVYGFKFNYSFKNADGNNPIAGLINVGGTLYGTTQDGGTGTHCGGSGCGTVFSIDPITGAEEVLYSFNGGFQGGSGGGAPSAGLINVNGTLYGTTENGGGTGCGACGGLGTVFSIKSSGAETVVYRFKGGGDGEYPVAGLINVRGTFYGTTNEGGGTGCGGSGCGTVFSINPTTGAEKVLYSFKGGSDGKYPLAGLIDVNGSLYGTTSGGGKYRWGTVFSITP